MDRYEAHRAKMKSKAARVLVPGFTPVEDKRFAKERLLRRLNNQDIRPNLSRWSRFRPTKNDDAAYRKPFARVLA